MAHDAGAFRLEVGVFPIQRMTFASETRYQDGTLRIDRAALLAAIAEPRSSPIWKSTWPILGSHAALSMCSIPSLPWLKYRAARRSIRGSSTRPCRLGWSQSSPPGAAVIVCATFPDPTSGALSPVEATIDMSGPAAPYCACSDTVNVVLVCHPAPGGATLTSTLRTAPSSKRRFTWHAPQQR